MRELWKFTQWGAFPKCRPCLATGRSGRWKLLVRCSSSCRVVRASKAHIRVCQTLHSSCQNTLNDDDTTIARARTRNRAVTAGALSHGTTAARECRRTTSASQPPTRSNWPRWREKAATSGCCADSPVQESDAKDCLYVSPTKDVVCRCEDAVCRCEDVVCRKTRRG